MQYDVSILIPNYNHGKYIKEEIERIFSQDISIKKEVIFGDDGSTDNSLEIIQPLAKKHPITVVASQKNCGVIETINRIVPLAKGEFVAFKALDDFYEEGFFTETVSYLQKNPKDAFVVTNPLFLDEKTKKLSKQELLISTQSIDLRNKKNLLTATNFWIPSHATLFRGKVLPKEELYHSDLHSFTDWFLSWELALKEKQFGYIAKSFSVMRISASSYSQKANSNNDILEKSYENLVNRVTISKFSPDFFNFGILHFLGTPFILFLLKRPRKWKWLYSILRTKARRKLYKLLKMRREKSC